jgi:CRP/FNR family transcriptional regulator, cyclic AMP receptor protein
MRSLNLIDKAFLLKKSPLFGTLDLDLLLSIADKMETLFFRSAECVFQPDQEAYSMYLIVSGQLTAVDRDQTTLAELSPGDYFGEESLFNEKKRCYAVLCKTKAQLLALSRSHLISIIHECPSVALSLLESYSAQLNFRSR